MASYLSLEEAAEQLGITTERLIELRSQGQVRGFRDGASWKFPDNEIERVQENLADILSGGSGIIGEDELASDGSGGSDLELGNEPLQVGSGSDVNLVPAEGEGSDVAVVASDSDLDFESSAEDLLEIDSGELQLGHPALVNDSGQLDLAVEPNAGSTGPVTDEELKEIEESHPDVLSPEPAAASSGGSSMLDIAGDDIKLESESDLSFGGAAEDEDSDEALIGDADSGMDVLGSDIAKGGSQLSSAGASSLELMDELDDLTGESSVAALGSRDVLSELDLMAAEQEGSGLISGDSENLLTSSGLGSSIGADALAGSDLSALEDDDALADDDDLVIADDDDDLVISSAGSDISVAGDSGINLMSPSDSGLSLESEPLDLAGSSISALDLARKYPMAVRAAAAEVRPAMVRQSTSRPTKNSNSRPRVSASMPISKVARRSSSWKIPRRLGKLSNLRTPHSAMMHSVVACLVPMKRHRCPMPWEWMRARRWRLMIRPSHPYRPVSWADTRFLSRCYNASPW